jgi:hypothetical protein
VLAVHRDIFILLLMFTHVFHMAPDEESVAIEEVRALGEAVNEVELSVESEDLDVMLDRHPSSSDTKGLQTGSRYSAAAEVRTSEGRSLLM